MERRNPESIMLTAIHWAFIVSCFAYAAAGWFMFHNGSIPVNAYIPARFAMIALAPGVAAGIGGILLLRRAAGSRDRRLPLHLAGCALLEGLAITGLIVFILSGGATTPLYTGCFLAAILLFLHRPSLD